MDPTPAYLIGHLTVKTVLLYIIKRLFLFLISSKTPRSLPIFFVNHNGLEGEQRPSVSFDLTWPHCE